MSRVDDRLASFADEIIWMERRPVAGGSDGRMKTALLRGSQIASALSREEQLTMLAHAHAVREHVRHLIRRTPQVVVKVTGGGADMKRVETHLKYIQRRGQLPLENENGDVFLGQSGREQAQLEFAQGGYPIPAEIRDTESSRIPGTRRRRRETLHVIFSMPGGTVRVEVMHAARAAARELFQGHQWLTAHHDDTNNPHSHFLVKMVGHDGRRMNPRIADLEHWRIVFARELQARGIEAVATRRRVRLQRQQAESQAVREIRLRGEVPMRVATSRTQPVAAQRALENETRIRRAYAGVLQALSESDSADDRRLARELGRFMREQGWKVELPPSPRMGL